ncbi:MAG: cupin-like domain-containing protein [Paracoccaceae bacterium]
MNVSYPTSEFASEAAALDGFLDLIVQGFENPEGVSGTVLLEIPERPDQTVVFHFGETLRIERGATTQNPDTVVQIPLGTIQRIFAEFEYLDFRDPSIIGTIEFSGNLDFANHLGRSCLRPSNFALERFRLVAEQHRQLGYRNLTSIERLHQPTQMDILEVIEASRPVIITGMEPVPPCKDWSLKKLSDRYGNAITRVQSASSKQTMREFVQELEAFIANPKSGTESDFVKPYTEGGALPEEMWADFGPLFFDREDFIPPQLWLGAVPTHIPTSSLHRDPYCGFLLQVIGRKRLDLYSADQAELLHPHKAYNNYQPCWFKPEQPNYDIYPNAQAAKCLSVTLKPGEMIVQPAGWFHQVYALDSPNMSVSYFWRY